MYCLYWWFWTGIRPLGGHILPLQSCMPLTKLICVLFLLWPQNMFIVSIKTLNQTKLICPKKETRKSSHVTMVSLLTYWNLPPFYHSKSPITDFTLTLHYFQGCCEDLSEVFNNFTWNTEIHYFFLKGTLMQIWKSTYRFVFI